MPPGYNAHKDTKAESVIDIAFPVFVDSGKEIVDEINEDPAVFARVAPEEEYPVPETEGVETEISETETVVAPNWSFDWTFFSAAISGAFFLAAAATFACSARWTVPSSLSFVAVGFYLSTRTIERLDVVLKASERISRIHTYLTPGYGIAVSCIARFKNQVPAVQENELVTLVAPRAENCVGCESTNLM
ncbi:hypothetical protein ABFX02_04G078400 [Erythranthe guttata]